MGDRPLRWCRVTQPFANPGRYASLDDAHGRAGHHTGIDFGRDLRFPTLRGAKVRSSTPGEVVISAYNPTMGNWVGVFDATQNLTITYWHLGSRKVDVGDRVQVGDLIGRVGSTGNSTAPHLHVQANYGRGFNYAAHVDPSPWVRGERWAGQPAAKKGRR